MNYFIKFIFIIFVLFPSFCFSQDDNKLLPGRTLGLENAQIIIEEYASMSCGHCANFHIKVLPDIKEKYIDTGKAKLIFRDFPLDRTAMIGSMITQCMNNEQFFSVLNRLFQTQQKWVQSENIIDSIFEVLLPLGIEKTTLLSCLEDNETNKNRWKLLLEGRDYAAKNKGVDATPYFFVNGNKVEGKFDLNKLDMILK